MFIVVENARIRKMVRISRERFQKIRQLLNFSKVNHAFSVIVSILLLSLRWSVGVGISLFVVNKCVHFVKVVDHTVTPYSTDKSRRKLHSTENFIAAKKDSANAWRLQTRAFYNTLQWSTVKLPLPTEDIIWTCFQYNGKHCKQLHGTAVCCGAGSPT